jgi:hypothetical protein
MLRVLNCGEICFYELEMVISGAKNFKHIGILTLTNMLP